MTSTSCNISPTASWSCISARSSRSGRRRRSISSRGIPTRGRCSIRALISTRSSASRPHRCRAIRPIQSILHPAAGSTPAARLPRRSAPKARPTSAHGRIARPILPLATWPTPRPATAGPEASHPRCRASVAPKPMRPIESGSLLMDRNPDKAARVGSPPPLVEVEDLHVRFTSRHETVKAVNGISFNLRQGEVLCIIGESGSGKSVTLRALMRLLPKSRTQITGRMRVGKFDVLALNELELTKLRGSIVSMIFQEPMTALDPVYTIGHQIAETVLRHEHISRRAALDRAIELLDLVKVPSPERRLSAYPHELSGGLRQRALIAIALSCRPSLLLADEPTTALDATVQIQVLVMLRDLQREFGMGLIFVTHDLGVAAQIADQVA